ncbi:MAG: Hsp20/alpha crystallin family protein [Desulfosudaceae bacterium]
MQLMPRRNRTMPTWRRTPETARDMMDILDRFWTETPFATALSDWEPSVDVSESNGNMQVRAELPGLNPEDIDVNVTGDLLTIKGEKTSESEEEDRDFYRRESFTGAFQRTIPLPEEADSENVQASFKNGVLNITLPKTESTRSKKVEITAE